MQGVATAMVAAAGLMSTAVEQTVSQSLVEIRSEPIADKVESLHFSLEDT